MNYGHWTLMKFHREALISNISYSSMSTCPLGANQPFEGLIRLSICCQLCSFSTNSRHLGQVIPVTKLICIQGKLQSAADKNNRAFGIQRAHCSHLDIHTTEAGRAQAKLHGSSLRQSIFI